MIYSVLFLLVMVCLAFVISKHQEEQYEKETFSCEIRDRLTDEQNAILKIKNSNRNINYLIKEINYCYNIELDKQMILLIKLFFEKIKFYQIETLSLFLILDKLEQEDLTDEQKILICRTKFSNRARIDKYTNRDNHFILRTIAIREFSSRE